MGSERFKRWMKQVDTEIRNVTGGEVSSHLDFADWDYTGAFESDDSPRDAALDALEADGFPVDLIDS